MRNIIGTKNLILGSLALLLSYGPMRADVTWNGSATDVINQDLTILGNSTLSPAVGHDYVQITATSQAILVTVDADAIISGATSAPTLFVEPIDYDITFSVQHNLTFAGTSSVDGSVPLFIAVRGGHNVIFDVDGGESITLAPTGTNGGSAQLYVIMDGTVMQFNRSSVNPDADIFVTVGPQAALGYATDSALGTGGVGSILFDPTNTGTGPMALQIEDQGAVIISGRQIINTTQESYDLTLSDIVTTEPAGCQALFETVNTQTNAASRLVVLNENNTLTQSLIWQTTYTGPQYGFVLGNNGKLSIGTYTYLDYIGLSLDQCFPQIAGSFDNCCSGNCAEDFCLTSTRMLFKKRNPSALIVDGSDSVGAVPACIDLNDQSAIVFRSGVNCEGVVENDLSSEYPYTISHDKRTRGAGNMVFDVEGCLTIAGSGTDPMVDPTKLEILSLNVTPTGATVLIDGTGSMNFPARDFATYFQFLRAYNSGYFFINNNVVLCKTFLVHTDQNHRVFDNDDCRSEPTYVGGEINKFMGKDRPRILFSNSTFMVHTSVAFTGVDLSVPNALECCLSCTVAPSSCLVNATPCDNLSKFIFFYNGYAKDNGTGRQFILGTYPGSTSCDCCQIINQDSHLDIMQLTDQSCTCSNAHELVLTVSPNNGTIIQGVPDNITGQYSVNTIFLGHGSNISIGSPCDQVPTNSSCPTLTIDGNYFAFGAYCPQLSNITGQGGIFVDCNGTIRTINTCGVNMGVMVTKSGNGVIDLAEPIVRFGCEVGEADWRLDLSVTQTIIPSGADISDYVLNWNTICKNPNFVPFMCDCTACPSNAATTANVTGLPTILGQVDQLLIKGSAIGYPAHIMVGLGGNVRELVFLDSCRIGFAPTAVVALENGGRVGLGSAHTNVDSLDASVVMGNNGITIIANGDGVVYLNEDIVINNVCHIVQGPSFTSANRLLIASECCRTIRVKNTGVLDLSSFTVGGVVQIGGEVKLILEPGAKVIYGNVELQFTLNAGIFCEPVSPELLPTTVPTDLTALDPFRVKFIGGQGIIRFKGCSYFTINENAFVGVETSPDCTINTNLTFILEDTAKWSIGACDRFGGAFEVGNTSTQTDAIITFSLLIDGNQAEFAIGQEAFVGLGVAVASKLPDSVPNNWYVGTAFNVNAITINVQNGTFTHNVIADGNTSTDEFYLVGSALAFGGDELPQFDINFTDNTDRRVTNVSRSTVRGGGNVFLSSSSTPTAMNIQSLNTSTVGILASDPLFQLSVNRQITGNASTVFNGWRTADIAGSDNQYASRCDVGPFIHNEMMAGYVDRGFIQRSEQTNVVGSAGTTTNQTHTINIGAAGAVLVPSTNTAVPRDIKNLSILS